MKITKTANNKKRVTLSKKEWEAIGKQANWMGNTHPRANTNKALELMDEGMLDPRAVADMALSWLSDADVKEMMQENDIGFFVGSDEDEELDDEDEFGEDDY